MFLDRFLKPVEAFVNISQARVNDPKSDSVDVCILSELLQLFEKFLRFTNPPYQCVGKTEYSQVRRPAPQKLCCSLDSPYPIVKLSYLKELVRGWQSS